LPLAATLLLLPLAVLAAEPPASVVQVKGQGEASVVPDRARLSMAIEARNAELAAAEKKVNDSTRAALAELKSLGIKDEDIATAGYSVNPEYDWVNNQQKFRGYFARREVNVTVKKLDQIGDVILKLTKAGVNQINPPVLESSKIKDAERGALAAAMDDAVGQARVVAEGLTMRLGPARTVNATGEAMQPQVPVPMPRGAMAMKAMDATPELSGNEQVGFSAGLIRATATVTAEFELLPAKTP
jgi:uncharacterized protein YggE